MPDASRIEELSSNFQQVETVRSESNIGVYGEFKLVKYTPTREVFCSCPSFLSHGWCKHLRERGNEPRQDEGDDLELREVVQKLRVAGGKRLKPSPSWAGRLFQIKLFADYQNLSVREALSLAERVEQGEANFFPLRTFGVEIEGGFPGSPSELESALNSEGVRARDIRRYSHRVLDRWRIGRDSSVSLSSHLSEIEIASPKLFGAGSGGMEEVRKLLRVWNRYLRERTRNRIGVNSTCGCHTHVDVYDLSSVEALRALIAFYALQDHFFAITPRSRHNNRFCEKLKVEDFGGAVGYPLYPEFSTRYKALNYAPLGSRHAAEFRLFGASTVFKKVSSFLIMSLMFIEKMKQTESVFDIADLNEFDQFLNWLGLNGRPLLERAKGVIQERAETFGFTRTIDVETRVKEVLKHILPKLKFRSFIYKDALLIGRIASSDDQGEVLSRELPDVNQATRSTTSVAHALVSYRTDDERAKYFRVVNYEGRRPVSCEEVKITRRSMVCSCGRDRCRHRTIAAIALGMLRASADEKAFSRVKEKVAEAIVGPEKLRRVLLNQERLDRNFERRRRSRSV